MSGCPRRTKGKATKATRPQPPAAKQKPAGEAVSSGSCESGDSELGDPVDITDVNVDEAESHLCGVCDRPVKDEGDGILCEGDCVRWFHPKRAKLSESDYNRWHVPETRGFARYVTCY